MKCAFYESLEKTFITILKAFRDNLLKPVYHIIEFAFSFKITTFWLIESRKNFNSFMRMEWNLQTMPELSHTQANQDSLAEFF